MSYVRVSILGGMTGGEVWSINPVFDPTAEWGDTVDQTALDAAGVAIAALNPGTTLTTGMSSLLTITGARVEVRSDNDDSLIAITQATRTTPWPGAGTPAMPPQAAVVMSLRTNTPGASGRGRLYWPCLGTGLTSSGRIATATVALYNSNMKTYLLAQRDALAAAFPTIGYNLAVRSRLTKTTPHVVRMQVGDVVDTQRRRRDKFPESYNSVTIP